MRRFFTTIVSSPLFTTVSLFLAILLGGALPSARAQGGSTGQPPAQGRPQSFKQGQLEAYAAAAVKIQEIAQKWKKNLQSAQGDEEARTIRAQANREMVQAVRDEGLTVEEYNRIFRAAQGNSQLANQIRQLMGEAR